MSRNMANSDRWIRAILGAVLLLSVFTGPHTAWGWLGVPLLVTAFVGICPLYRLFGWTTRGKVWAAK